MARKVTKYCAFYRNGKNLTKNAQKSLQKCSMNSAFKCTTIIIDI